MLLYSTLLSTSSKAIGLELEIFTKTHFHKTIEKTHQNTTRNPKYMYFYCIVTDIKRANAIPFLLPLLRLS